MGLQWLEFFKIKIGEGWANFFRWSLGTLNEKCLA